MGNPPPVVKMALEGICILLGENASDWKSIRTAIMKDSFIPTIVSYKTDDITWVCWGEGGARYSTCGQSWCSCQRSLSTWMAAWNSAIKELVVDLHVKDFFDLFLNVRFFICRDLVCFGVVVGGGGGHFVGILFIFLFLLGVDVWSFYICVDHFMHFFFFFIFFYLHARWLYNWCSNCVCVQNALKNIIKFTSCILFLFSAVDYLVSFLFWLT